MFYEFGGHCILPSIHHHPITTAVTTTTAKHTHTYTKYPLAHIHYRPPYMNLSTLSYDYIAFKMNIIYFGSDIKMSSLAPKDGSFIVSYIYYQQRSAKYKRGQHQI